MSRVKETYNQKSVSAEEAVSYLVGVNNLILGMSIAMPPALLEAVAKSARSKEVGPLNVYYCLKF